MNANSLRNKFEQLHPGTFFLDEEDIVGLETFLREKDWLENNDVIRSLEKPGEGNMNFVLRVTPQNGDSFIVKQSRPWVEKYPTIDAPIDRILVEYQYYQTANLVEELQLYSPIVIGIDADHYFMVLEDLGETSDNAFAYQLDQSINDETIRASIQYLNLLQKVEVPQNYPDNMEMRILNHQHIFNLPFLENNGFNLDDIQPGLQELAAPYQKDPVLRNQVQRLGALYLDKGTAFLHGDFYPGSILNTGQTLKVIDPEFSFIGPPEWDIAIFIAHLYMTQAAPDIIHQAFDTFDKSTNFNQSNFHGFVGTEILRRIIGLAQLPLEMDLATKKTLLSQARKWIVEGRE